MFQHTNLLIDAILRATNLGYKVTFLGGVDVSGVGSGQIVIQIREFEPRGPCSVMWNSGTQIRYDEGESLDDETVATAVNMLIEALFEVIERLPDVRLDPKDLM